jgi:hypothetical protein
MLTSEIINVLRKNGYRLTALDTGSDLTVSFVLGVKLDDPIDAWYIAQTLAVTNAAVVPQFSKDMKTLAFMNVPLNEKDFESILAVY